MVLHSSVSVKKEKSYTILYLNSRARISSANQFYSPDKYFATDHGIALDGFTDAETRCLRGITLDYQDLHL